MLDLNNIADFVWNHTTNSVIVTDKDGTIVQVNEGFEQISGWTRDEVIGQNPRMFSSGLMSKSFYENMWDTISSGKPWSGRFTNKTKKGELIYDHTTIYPIQSGGEQYYVAIKENETILEEYKHQLDNVLYFNSITGLPNRESFIKNGYRLFGSDDMNSLAITIVDIDNFKHINDIMGYETGDKVIQTVASTLCKMFNSRNDGIKNTIYHTASDEFVVFSEGFNEKTVIGGYQAEILNEIRHTQISSINDSNMSFFITVSIGSSCYPDDADGFMTLLKKADTALYNAKKGRNTGRFWEPSMDEFIELRETEQDLRKALISDSPNNQFTMKYQPQICLNTGKVVGAEALIRWNHPEKGFVSPGYFIPLAESSDVIIPLTVWIFEECFKQISVWQNCGTIDFPISINVPGALFKFNTLPRFVDAMLNKYKVDPEFVVFEITETTLVDDVSDAIKLCNHFKKIGIDISIDDFGTGYSNITALSKMPIQKLKIDKSFIDQLDNSPMLTTTVIQLADNFGMKTIAEGVETDEQSKFLDDKKCSIGQGWLWSRELSPEDFEKFLATK